jgi:23S rRNA pseudouridine1911/1915/1917 synthase
LDKNTSGVMVIAKNAAAFASLAKQFRDRMVRKEYVALVWGRPSEGGGIINRPVGRHRTDRKKMSSLHFVPRVREAITEWQLEECFRVKTPKSESDWVSLLRLRPQTGRTHQIRVHLADQGYPIVGDVTYGSMRTHKERLQVPGIGDFPRQALHAEKLFFRHPQSDRGIEFCAPLWPDVEGLLQRLREPSPAAVGLS